MKLSTVKINKEVMSRIRKKKHFSNYTDKDGMVALKAIDSMIKYGVKKRMIIDFGLFRIKPNYKALSFFFINNLRFRR
jgi:hypothetical protein